MNHLRSEIGSGAIIRLSDELGIPTSAREAIGFALLAAATLDGEPSNVPSATGARHRAILGSIAPAPRGVLGKL
jgi:anhydro-N-acetylmuramic acid kinase